MKNRKSYIGLVFLISLLCIATVAFASAGPQFGSRNLYYGRVGVDVQQLQGILNNNAFSLGVADGVFGIKTKNAAINFQKANKLNPDGIVGPMTFKVLNGIVAKKTGSKNNIKIAINKTKRQLILYSGATPLKTYHVEIGDAGLDNKNVAGDHKTPEGSFYITEKLVLSPQDKYLGTRWMRLSYPNIEAAGRGLNSRLIDNYTYNSIVNSINTGGNPPRATALGGGIGIHGGNDTNGPNDWTWGCIGLSNADVNEIFNYVSVGTTVVIMH